MRSRSMPKLRVHNFSILLSGPVLLGSGENLFVDINTPALGYECTEHATTENAMRFILRKRVG